MHRTLHEAALHAALVLLFPFGAFAAPSCTCDAVGSSQGYCEEHDVGWIAGFRIDSPVVFEALDLHGHDLGPEPPACEVCRSGRFCTIHNLGLVGGQAYFSPLAFELARGTVQDPAKLGCAKCRENAKSHGWCESCGIGRAGTVMLRDRASYEVVGHWMDVLLAARDTARRCTLCAAAMVSNGRCPTCKLRYLDGEATPDPGR